MSTHDSLPQPERHVPRETQYSTNLGNDSMLTDEERLLALDYLEDALSEDQILLFEQLSKKESFVRFLSELALDEAELYANLGGSLKLRTELHQEMLDVEKFKLTRLPENEKPTKYTYQTIMKSAVLLSLFLGISIWGGLHLFSRNNLQQKAVVQKDRPLQQQSQLSIQPKLPSVPDSKVQGLNNFPVIIHEKLSGLPIVREMSGEITLENLPLVVMSEIPANKTLFLKQTASLLCTYTDGTNIYVQGPSSLNFSEEAGQKKVQILKGNVAGSVAKQPPGKPLLMITQDSMIEVVGTELAVSSNNNTTDLSVSEGIVKMQRKEDGKQVELVAGQCVETTGKKEMQVQKLRTISTSWSEGFDQDIKELWKGGTWFNSEDDKQGVVFLPIMPENNKYQINTIAKWTAGLFQLTPNSHLNLTIKLDSPSFYHVMLNVRSRDFQFNEGCGTFEYQESNFNRIPVGEWRTVSIPIAEFKKTSKSVSNDIGFEFRPGVPPVTDGVVFNLLVNSEKIDQQMWIDKIWVTQEPVLE